MKVAGVVVLILAITLGGPLAVAWWRARHRPTDEWEQWRPRRKPGYDPDPQWLEPEDETE